MKVQLAELVPHPLNSNVVPESVLEKLERNIKRTGKYPPIEVRELEDGRFGILDGHHRVLVLQRLGHAEGEAHSWGKITEREADLALATLNTLRGTEDPRKRAELLDALAQSIPLEQMAAMVPEDMNQLLDMQRLLAVDLTALEAAATEQAKRVAEESPAPLHFVLYPDQLAKVRQALDHIKETNDLAKGRNPEGMALYYLAVNYLSEVGFEAAESLRQEDEPAIGSGEPA